MTDEGLVDLAPGRAFHKHGGLPRVTVLRVAAIEGSNVWAVPERWEAAGPAPRLAVEVAVGADIIADIGDRDDRPETALVAGLLVGDGPDGVVMVALVRSEERRVGKECVSTCRSRWSPSP